MDTQQIPPLLRCPGPSPGCSKSGDLIPGSRRSGQPQRADGGQAEGRNRKRRLDPGFQMGERGGHQGRASPRDWQRLWAGRGGGPGAESGRACEKLWRGLGSPLLPALLPTSPFPSSPPPPAQVAASPGSRSPFPTSGRSSEGGQGPQQGAGPGPSAVAGGSRRTAAPRTRAVSPRATRGGWRAGRAGGRGAREEGAALRRVNGAKVNPAALKGAGLLLPGAGAAGRLQGDAGRSAIAGRLGRRAGGRAMPSLRRPAPRVQALRTEGCFAFSGPPPLPGVDSSGKNTGVGCHCLL